MKISRRFLMGLTGLSVAATVALPVFAATPATTTQTDPRDTLIQALVQRFNLNQSDVQQFFRDQETQRFNEQLTNLETRLAADVTAGNLTEAQKTALIAKAKEARTKMESFRSLSAEVREQSRKTYCDELKAWLTQQGIKEQYLHVLMGPMGGPGGHGMNGERPPMDGQGNTQNGTTGQSAQNQGGARRGGPRGMFGGARGGMTNGPQGVAPVTQ